MTTDCPLMYLYDDRFSLSSGFQISFYATLSHDILIFFATKHKKDSFCELERKLRGQTHIMLNHAFSLNKIMLICTCGHVGFYFKQVDLKKLLKISCCSFCLFLLIFKFSIKNCIFFFNQF